MFISIIKETQELMCHDEQAAYRCHRRSYTIRFASDKYPYVMTPPPKYSQQCYPESITISSAAEKEGETCTKKNSTLKNRHYPLHYEISISWSVQHDNITLHRKKTSATTWLCGSEKGGLMISLFCKGVNSSSPIITSSFNNMHAWTKCQKLLTITT